MRASVLVVGVGGLGSPAALYLAAAGVGKIRLVDFDSVAASNLHRQILFGTRDIGRAKVEAGAERLGQLNPDASIEAVSARFDASNARALVRDADVVLDGSDNFATRYLANDACVLERVPLVHGGVVNFRGQVMSIAPGRSACLRCVFPEPPRVEEVPSCQQAGVLGAEAGIIGSLMAHEALKLLLGIGEPLFDTLVIFDGRRSDFRQARVRRDSACAVCGADPVIATLQPESSGAPCSQDFVADTIEALS